MGPEEHDKYLALASSLGPGAPANWQMLLANFCYVGAFFLGVWTLSMTARLEE